VNNPFQVYPRLSAFISVHPWFNFFGCGRPRRGHLWLPHFPLTANSHLADYSDGMREKNAQCVKSAALRAAKLGRLAASRIVSPVF
jgi:hypothetical protein